MILSVFSSLTLAVASFSGTTDAFQHPLPVLVKPLTAATAVVGGSSMPSMLDANNGDAITAAVATVSQHSSYVWIAEDGGGGIFDTVRNIAAGITAVLFLLAGITYLYGSYIIPAAAQELEKECKELDPQLWDQYVAKLGPGETIASRPDLMQELGMKLQPMIEAKLREMDSKGELNALQTTLNPYAKDDSSSSSSSSSSSEGGDAPTIPSTASQWDSNDGIIDVEVEKKTKSDEND